MPNDLAQQLKQIPLFAKLSRGDLQAVAQLVARADYPAGSEIYRQGQPGQTAFFVEGGELRALRVDPEGIEREVARWGPGESFGETSLMLGEPHDATVEVVQDATLLYLNKCDFDQLLHERPAVLNALQMRPDVAKKRLARRFRWQDPDEAIIVRLHKHYVILIRNIALPCFLLLMDLVGVGYWYAQSPSTLALVAGILLGLAPLLLIVYMAVDNYNDNYIVTNKRVVHEERVPLVHESRTEAFLHTVQDVQQVREGLLAQVYNFGNLIIETAGERGHVVFRQIPDPTGTRDIIFEQIERVRAGARAEERAAIRETLRRQFGVKTPEAPAPAPEPPCPEPRFKLTLPSWVRAPIRVVRYFVPPLRVEQGDTITWRKHWFFVMGPIAVPTALIIVATTITIYLMWHRPTSWSQILLGYGLAMVVLFPWWLWIFDDWQNDIYQVTTTRIIDVERLPLFLREERREASLGMIQNINLEIPGILGQLLKYGSVNIETAGAGAFTFDHVADPRAVQSEIFRRVEAFQSQQRQAEAERRRTELLDWFSVYDQVRNSAPPASPPPRSHQLET
jgi:hypothetical protein